MIKRLDHNNDYNVFEVLATTRKGKNNEEIAQLVSITVSKLFARLHSTECRAERSNVPICYGSARVLQVLRLQKRREKERGGKGGEISMIDRDGGIDIGRSVQLCVRQIGQASSKLRVIANVTPLADKAITPSSLHDIDVLKIRMISSVTVKR